MFRILILSSLLLSFRLLEVYSSLLGNVHCLLEDDLSFVLDVDSQLDTSEF